MLTNFSIYTSNYTNVYMPTNSNFIAHKLQCLHSYQLFVFTLLNTPIILLTNFSIYMATTNSSVYILTNFIVHMSTNSNELL